MNRPSRLIQDRVRPLTEAGAALWLATALIVVSSLTDLPRRLSVGPITGLGLLTALFTLWALVISIRSRQALALLRRALWPFVGLFLLALVSMPFPPTQGAIQQLELLLLFPMVVAAVAVGARSDRILPPVIDRALAWASGLAAIVYILSVIIDVRPRTGVVFGSISFAMFATLAMAWQVARWRYGRPGAGFLSLLLLAAIILAQSRTAIILGAVLAIGAHIRFRTARDRVRTAALVAAVVLGLAALTQLPGFQRRFFNPGEGLPHTTVSVFGFKMDTSGRRGVWSITWNHYLESPWIGHGTGSSQALMEAETNTVSYPLNTYLRLLHDFGPIGVALWLAGLGLLAFRSWRGWRASTETRADEAHVHLGALLALVAFAVFSLTSQVEAFVFVVGPLAVFLGLSMGRADQLRADAAAP
jgi:O-antigen ligase